MTVNIRFMLHLLSSADLSVGKKTVSMEIKEGSTFGELLKCMEDAFGSALAEEIYDSGNESLQDTVLAIINGTLAHNFDGTKTLLHDGDSIIFVPVAMGG